MKYFTALKSSTTLSVEEQQGRWKQNASIAHFLSKNDLIFTQKHVFPSRIELETFRVLGECDTNYTTETLMSNLQKSCNLKPTFITLRAFPITWPINQRAFSAVNLGGVFAEELQLQPFGGTLSEATHERVYGKRC